jgi:cysteine desulfurase/selenocysteine lyase
VVAPFLQDAEKLAAVREALPAVSAGIYFDTPRAGPLPAETARSMSDLAGWEVATGRAGSDRREEALSRVDEARAAVAAILTTDVDAVVLTNGLRDAFAIASATVDCQPGDRILRVGHPDPGLGGAMPGVDVPAGEGSAVLAALDREIQPAIRLVVCPQVDAATGARLPIAEIARLVRDRGALLLVDGSQAAGAIPVTIDEDGADFYAVPASTWLLGPEGLAALAASERHRDRLVGARDGAGTLYAPPTRQPGPFGFHLPSVVGFGRSCGWLSMYVGLEWIHRRSTELARAAVGRLESIDGVTVVTPREARGTVVTFAVRGWPAELLLEELGARVFAIASVVPSLDAVRIGLGFFNTEDEIERFTDAVALLAAHTPETVPPRRRLTVLGGAS